MCHEQMWFSTRDEIWCLKPSSPERASSGLQYQVSSAYTPSLQPDHAVPFAITSSDVKKKSASIVLNSTSAAEAAHLSDAQYCAHVIKVTAIPTVITMLCQNKSTAIRQKSLSALIKDLPMGFSKCKAYLIIAFLHFSGKNVQLLMTHPSQSKFVC